MINYRRLVISVLLAGNMALCAYADQSESSQLPANEEVPSFADNIKFVGIAVTREKCHIWGCSPVVGDDGKVHLFGACWDGQFNLGWRTNSRIVHYVADKPQGPFKFVEVVYKGEHKEKGQWNYAGICNPCIKKVDDKYVLLFIANSHLKFHPRKVDEPSPENHSIGMMIADSVNGPWSEPKQVLAPSKRKHWTRNSGNGVCNPAFVKFKGKYMIYYKSNGAKYGVAIADKLEGPYIHHPEPVTKNKTVIEDGYAFVWNGKVNLVTTDNKGIIARKGGLLWQSDDGVTFSQPVRGFYPFGQMVSKKDFPKNRQVYGDWAIERPQVLMLDGRPAWFYAPSGSSLTGRDCTDCLV